MSSCHWSKTTRGPLLLFQPAVLRRAKKLGRMNPLSLTHQQTTIASLYCGQILSWRFQSECATNEIRWNLAKKNTNFKTLPFQRNSWYIDIGEERPENVLIIREGSLGSRDDLRSPMLRWKPLITFYHHRISLEIWPCDQTPFTGSAIARKVSGTGQTLRGRTNGRNLV